MYVVFQNFYVFSVPEFFMYVMFRNFYTGTFMYVV